MAYNRERSERMKKFNVSELKKRVDAGSLSSAAASYALREYHDIEYTFER